MSENYSKFSVGVVGLGTMGLGIAQLVATKGHHVFLFDSVDPVRDRALPTLTKNLEQRRDRGKLDQMEFQAILSRITVAESICGLSDCSLVIEAVIEDLSVKQQIFSGLEKIVSTSTILATNTSSLSVTEIATACEQRNRVVGLHFFNPAQVMPLVEIVPTASTSPEVVEQLRELALSWDKIPVAAKDSPGFIVNRIARPFYGEALKILEEKIADVPTIDAAMKSQGDFSMGPFELVDLIGNDINLAVSETVWRAFDCAPRFAPSPLQKQMVESGLLGKKSGRGFYDYSTGAATPLPLPDSELQQDIFLRIISMLINEAVDAFASGVASRNDIDTAMQKGVNYPKGLLRWADELGLSTVESTLTGLQEKYNNDRYRPHPLLKKMAAENSKFYG